jgi:hypothetical protein
MLFLPYDGLYLFRLNCRAFVAQETMKEEQYWLISVKAEDFFGPSPFDGKETAKIIALTPTFEEPNFSAVMNGIMDGLRIGRRTDVAYSFDIHPLIPNKILLDKLPSLQKWDSKNLKLWLAARSRDA